MHDNSWGMNWGMGWGMGWAMWMIPVAIILIVVFVLRNKGKK